jgi:formylmethanofuran dehydrogenase subunit C
MPLTLTLRESTSIPLEVDTVQLATVRAQSTDDVAATLIQRGNKQPTLGEFFDVSGSASEDNTLVWQGDCAKVKLIGSHLDDGHIVVEGNTGMHLGADMTGGSIVVHGNAADWVGAEMHGGRIHIHGNAGHLVGAAYRGSRRGMTGGEILVDGNAGNEVGHTMRRGTIAIGGNAGDGIGFNMIAGSVFVFGQAGIRPGAGMRRGTIGLFGIDEKFDFLPTFQFAGTDRPVFLAFAFRRLREMGFSVPEECFSAQFDRYCGDFLELGKGELVVRTQSQGESTVVA